jgi:uncharacterized membrane protein YoaK (UPF0700 family)
VSSADPTTIAPDPLARRASHRECAAPPVAHPARADLFHGTVDAVSYLGLGHVFTANMTGNVVLLGFGIAHAGGLPVLAPVVSMAAFVLGAGVGGAFSRRLGARHAADLVYALTIEAAILASVAILATTSPHPATLWAM